MKYTCSSCDYCTNDKSNFNKHLKRKRKCGPKTTRKSTRKTTTLDQKVPEKLPEKAHKGSQKDDIGSQRLTKTLFRHPKGSQKAHIGTQKPDFSPQNAVLPTQESIIQTSIIQTERTHQWICPDCNKTFKHNRNWNRHMRLYCKGKSLKTKILEEEKNKSLSL